MFSSLHATDETDPHLETICYILSQMQSHSAFDIYDLITLQEFVSKNTKV